MTREADPMLFAHARRFLAATALAFVAHAGLAAGPRTIGRIERASPGLDRLLPRDAVIEVLASGRS
jgi:hypothetical protein